MELQTHPDSNFVEYVLCGITEGFDIGFIGPPEETRSGNLKSALEHPEVIDSYLEEEIQAGRIEGPFEVPPFENFRCSPRGSSKERSYKM